MVSFDFLIGEFWDGVYFDGMLLARLKDLFQIEKRGKLDGHGGTSRSNVYSMSNLYSFGFYPDEGFS